MSEQYDFNSFLIWNLTNDIMKRRTQDFANLPSNLSLILRMHHGNLNYLARILKDSFEESEASYLTTFGYNCYRSIQGSCRNKGLAVKGDVPGRLLQGGQSVEGVHLGYDVCPITWHP